MRPLPTSSRPRRRAGALLLRLIALLVVLCAPGWVWAFTPPALEGHVTDPSRQLPPDVEQALEGKLAAFKAETTDEVAVFVVPSLGGEPVEDVAYQTFKAWRLGDAAKDNGVLFVWAPTERKVRIETGRGIGDRLTDVGSSRILREVVTPQLKAGKNPEAITAGVDAILAALRRQAPPPAPAGAAAEEDDGDAWIGLLIGLVVLGTVVGMFVAFLVVLIKAIQRANGTGARRGGPGAGWTGTGYDASHGPTSHRTWGSSYESGSSDGGGSSWDSGSSGGSDFSGGGGDSGGGGSSDSY